MLSAELFSNQFPFVKQFAFAHMSAVANVDLTGGAIGAQRGCYSLIMRPSFLRCVVVNGASWDLAYVRFLLFVCYVILF